MATTGISLSLAGFSLPQPLAGAFFGSGFLDLFVFNLLPLLSLLIGIVYSLVVLYRLKDIRLGVFTVLLVLVAVAEIIELVNFISAGDMMGVGSPYSETFETVIHVFAAFSVFYISRYIEREREAKNELKRRQVVLDKYRQVFENSESPAIITDNSYCITEVNNAFVEDSGYSRDELTGNQPKFIMEDEDVYEDVLEKVEKNESWTGEIRATAKDGRRKHYRGSVVPIVVNSDKKGYAGFFVDITRRKNYEESLDVMNRVLRHDLRNEMNVVKGYLEILEEEVEDEELLRYINESMTKADSLAHKSDTVRNLESFLQEYLDSASETVSLDRIIEDELSQTREIYSEVEFGIANSDGEAEVIGGKPLSKAINILLENAAKHADDENPSVEVGVERNGSEVVLSVADNGPGIPDDRKEMVFGREEVDQLHHGQGIDLFFVDRVVENYGGKAWVEDNEPKGTVLKLGLQPAD